MSTVQTPPPAQPALLTAEEFFRRYAGQPYELVRGRPVEVPMAGGKHGEVCGTAAYFVKQYALAAGTGRMMSNDTLLVTRRGPDGSRGMDVCFISYARLPKEQPTPDGPLEAVPEVVFEVRSPTDRWTDVIEKVLEYLTAGVSVVVVLDPKTESASVFRPDTRQEIFEKDQTLTIPDVLPGFSVPVSRFFE